MDNSQYTLGTDLYLVNKGGNTITDWKALARWARFVYLRASIGQVADASFVDAARAAHAVGLLVGAYHELWPDLNLTLQADVFNKQMSSLAFTLELPPAIAFEEQDITVKFRNVPKFPNPKDLIGMSERVLGVIVYIGLDGLNVCKSSGLDFSKFKYWAARYMQHPGIDGEMGVDVTVDLLKRDYGIMREQVLFMQTAKALPYPAGISPDKDADYDRAVSFLIPGHDQPQQTETNHVLYVHHVDGRVGLTESVTFNANLDASPIDQLQLDANIFIRQDQTTPTPEPTPAPTPRHVNRYRILRDNEMPDSYYGGKSRTAESGKTTPASVRINGVKSSYTLTDREVAAITRINAAYPHALAYISAHQGGWVNFGQWPTVECLTFEENFVDVLSIDPAKNRAYIRVWNGEDGSGVDDDCVIHHWTNIGPRGQIYTGSWHGPAFIALMYEEGAWIPLDKLEKVTA